MAFKFRKRIKIAPGVTLNLSKSGISTTFGTKGLSVNVGNKGAYLNTGIPGFGIYNRTKIAASVAQDLPTLGSENKEKLSLFLTKCKYRSTATVFALLAGWLGIHKFYLGKIKTGLLYLLLVPTGITLLLWVFDFIRLLTMSNEMFYWKYNNKIVENLGLNPNSRLYPYLYHYKQGQPWIIRLVSKLTYYGILICIYIFFFRFLFEVFFK